MKLVRVVFQGVKLLGYFVRFGVELLIQQPKTRQDRAMWLHRFCSTALPGMGVKLTVEGSFPERGAVISNHLSYVDIVVYAALHPCVFCSKAEIRAWPVLGWMTTMAGTVYVERGRGGSALRAKGGMQAAADSGLPVVFFPEGTTTSGDKLLPFHSGLLAMAMDVDEPIHAAFIHYSLEEENGPGVTASNSVAWGDDKPMLAHIRGFLSLRGVHATVRFATEPIAFSSDTLHRKSAAVEARSAVLELSADVLRSETVLAD